MSNPFDDPDYKKWANDLRKNLIPKMRGSQQILMLAPDIGNKFDIDFAVQIGATILMEKPLLLIVYPGRTVPPKLRAIADQIVEIEDGESDDVVQERIRLAVVQLERQ
jgi:hypothetical protein